MPRNSGLTAAEIFADHLDAFNLHSTQRLLAGFTADAQWITGTDHIRGKDDLAKLFGAQLWARDPMLTTVGTVTQGDRIAAELVEELTVHGERRRFHIAVFIRTAGGLISAAKVYREGSARLS